ncbi:hypothetical protein CC86DRAFT_401039 [Ophiobolus disseminans]|uniref:Probable double zinc ribbon domain-containing protein n=1 Tax=Ophiobolus disseminans TaxID=1469910 RepID=A0A6A7AG63_9PLEO|nr:hypothetical protein CC86DRAFT_401039 [Ophiobolus disseminans]
MSSRPLQRAEIPDPDLLEDVEYPHLHKATYGNNIADGDHPFGNALICRRCDHKHCSRCTSSPIMTKLPIRIITQDSAFAKSISPHTGRICRGCGLSHRRGTRGFDVCSCGKKSTSSDVGFHICSPNGYHRDPEGVAVELGLRARFTEVDRQQELAFPPVREIINLTPVLPKRRNAVHRKGPSGTDGLEVQGAQRVHSPPQHPVERVDSGRLRADSAHQYTDERIDSTRQLSDQHLRVYSASQYSASEYSREEDDDSNPPLRDKRVDSDRRRRDEEAEAIRRERYRLAWDI